MDKLRAKKVLYIQEHGCQKEFNLKTWMLTGDQQ